jgi:hypothetical protein
LATASRAPAARSALRLAPSMSRVSVNRCAIVGLVAELVPPVLASEGEAVG